MTETTDAETARRGRSRDAAARARGAADGRRPAARRGRPWPSAVGYPVDEVAAALAGLAHEYDEQGRGFELRNVAGGWRYYTREEYAAVVEALRPRRPAGPAHPGGARDARRGRLQAAGLAGPGLGDPRRQRRRRDAHAADPRAGRGGRSGRSSTAPPLPHHRLLPGADRRHLARRAARAGAVPPRHGRPRGRAGRRLGRPGVEAPGTDEPPPSSDGGETETDDEGLVRLQKLLAQSGVASRRKCEELMLAGAGRGRRRGRHPARHQGRPAHRGDPGRRQAAAAGRRDTSTWCSTSRAGVVSTMSDPRGPAHARRPRRRPARAALPRRPARHRHLGADPAHQRRRLRPPDGAPVVRGGQDLRRRGRRARSRRRRSSSCSTGVHARRRPGDGTRARGWSTAGEPEVASSSWSSTRAATGSCAGCSTTSATRCGGSPAPRSARSSSARSRRASCGT